MNATLSPLLARKVKVAANYPELSQHAAKIIADDLKNNPRLLLGSSAGGTPTGLYQSLAAMYNRQPRLFAQIRVLQVDEWCGLTAGHPASCNTDVLTKLTKPLSISGNRFMGFATDADRPLQECERVRTWLERNGPIDVCILGLGMNGHVAMNEPADSLSPGIHIAKLARQSQQHGMLTDLKTKPRQGFTLGMADILSSRRVLLLVNGSHKQKILAELLKGRVSARLPASLLWLHPNLTLICDAEALGKKLSKMLATSRHSN